MSVAFNRTSTSSSCRFEEAIALPARLNDRTVGSQLCGSKITATNVADGSIATGGEAYGERLQPVLAGHLKQKAEGWQLIELSREQPCPPTPKSAEASLSLERRGWLRCLRLHSSKTKSVVSKKNRKQQGI